MSASTVAQRQQKELEIDLVAFLGAAMRAGDETGGIVGDRDDEVTDRAAIALPPQGLERRAANLAAEQPANPGSPQAQRMGRRGIDGGKGAVAQGAAEAAG